VLRHDEPRARQLGLADQDLDDDGLIRILVENPDLLQRPIVVRGRSAVLARPLENLELLLAAPPAAAAAIRPARLEDAEALAGLAAQLGYPMETAEMRARLQGVERRGDGLVLMVEEGGAVVGWVHVLGVHLIESPAHAEIGGLVVDEARRGRRLGEALVAAAEDWAAAHGYGLVRVRSNVVRERARRFYERLGYHVTKTQAVFAKELRPPR
jgi:ribosomal protein S18 acetylase RimI-like enzyme